ncbi:extracellular solute-binding protein [Desulfopila sp. IMCC35006]|uniref:extracellular solute-binding protein n=1 Tax=Desulfopila sp. IMCC35006 TaxID=2569542 RepID=UPI001F0DCCC0|nr:extracellular solute-binding protein [Desulfopila sp. IMCC35006]
MVLDRTFFHLFFMTLFFSALFYPAHQALGSHGVSLDGSLKYAENFSHFDYTSPKAEKGGTLILHDIGSFDKMNPFTLKGSPPYGLEALIFEPLAVAALDEPFSQYGLLAKDIEVAADKKSVTFTLNPLARFSDGSPVTTADVAYSLDLMKSDKVHPQFNYYYADIAGYDVLGEGKIRFNFKRPNRELHMIATQINILPKKYHEQNGFAEVQEQRELLLPIGSGPYVVASVDIGKSITYKRNMHYWAKDHPTRKGIFNYDTIIVKYYKDPIIALEAFKAGEFDFISINIAKQWARDMDGRKFADGTLVKKTFPHLNNAGIQGFLMNTRRELFQDRKVRQALGLALDFSWINKSLFHDQYTRNNSFFSNSYLAAKGVPTGLELEYLEPYRQLLPQEVFTTPLGAPVTGDQQALRANLLQAKTLLNEAGWHVKDGVLTNAQGRPFVFDIMLVSPAFERVMASYVKNLKKLGIQASYRTLDQTLYVERLKTFDFDMIVAVYGQSQSPGNEQRNYWQSSSADKIGSQNYAGIRSPAVDGLVDRIIYAGTKNELVAACSALDRVLWYGYYLIPNWYLPMYRLSYRDKFLAPSVLPLYYDPFQLLMTWWLKK